MASFYDSICPVCETKFKFNKWDDEYRHTGILECPECETRYFEFSRELVENHFNKNVETDYIEQVYSYLNSKRNLNAEQSVLFEQARNILGKR